VPSRGYAIAVSIFAAHCLTCSRFPELAVKLPRGGSEDGTILCPYSGRAGQSCAAPHVFYERSIGQGRQRQRAVVARKILEHLDLPYPPARRPHLPRLSRRPSGTTLSPIRTPRSNAPGRFACRMAAVAAVFDTPTRSATQDPDAREFPCSEDHSMFDSS